MENLAGDYGCDPKIAAELEQAGVTLVLHSERLRREVPASITGQLTQNGKPVFEFVRAWYYWEVTGSFPMKIARELYKDTVGHKAIRVNGSAGNKNPDTTPSDGRPRVWCYHIDTQEGLNLFVVTLKKHGLID